MSQSERKDRIVDGLSEQICKPRLVEVDDLSLTPLYDNYAENNRKLPKTR